VSFSPEWFRFAILGSDDVSQSIIIRNDKCRYFLIEHGIVFQGIEESVPLFIIFGLEIVVRDSKVYEKLVSICSLSYYDMSKESLMGHLIISGES